MPQPSGWPEKLVASAPAASGMTNVVLEWHTVAEVGGTHDRYMTTAGLPDVISELRLVPNLAALGDGHHSLATTLTGVYDGLVWRMELLGDPTNGFTKQTPSTWEYDDPGWGYAFNILDVSPFEEDAAAAQLVTDQAAVDAGKADIKTTRTILAVTGTYDVAAANAAAAAAQLATDTGVVTNKASSIVAPAEGGETILGVEGTATAAGIAGRVVTFAPPVSENGTLLTLTPGNDYDLTSGQPLEWTDVSGDWPTLTGATITLTVRRRKADGTGDTTALLTKTGSVVTATGDTKMVRVQPLAADTEDLTPGNRVNNFDVTATLATGQKVTLVRGRCTVVDAQTRT